MFSSAFGRVMAIACISVLVMAAAPMLLSRSLAMYWDSVPMNSLGSEGYGIYERDMPVCWLFVRDNCVVDANTIRLGGQVIWITRYRAPQLDGRCETERQLAKQARQRLSELLSSGRFRVSPSGFGHSGVSPASIGAKSGDVAEILVGEGLAHGRRDRSADWCGEAAEGAAPVTRKEQISTLFSLAAAAHRCNFKLDRRAVTNWIRADDRFTEEEQIYANSLEEQTLHRAQQMPRSECPKWYGQADELGLLAGS